MDGLATLADACDLQRPPEPHWTLELLAVDPNAQNAGIGRKLMDFALRHIDDLGQATFLASSNARNLRFYERMGFDQTSTIDKTGLPAIYTMIRPAVIG